MTTIKLKSSLPVRTTEDQMRAHCAAFQLTLKSWSHNGHWIDIDVEETVTAQRQLEIAAAMTAQMAASLVEVRGEGGTFNIG